MAPIFANKIYDAARGATTWEVIYNRLEDKHPKIIVMRATTGSTKPSGLKCRDASYSFLHRIGAREKSSPTQT